MERNQMNGTFLNKETNISRDSLRTFSQANVSNRRKQQLVNYEKYYQQWGVRYNTCTGLTVPEEICLIHLNGLQPNNPDNYYYCPSVIPLLTPSILSTDALIPVEHLHLKNFHSQEFRSSRQKKFENSGLEMVHNCSVVLPRQAIPEYSSNSSSKSKYIPIRICDSNEQKINAKQNISLLENCIPSNEMIQSSKAILKDHFSKYRPSVSLTTFGSKFEEFNKNLKNVYEQKSPAKQYPISTNDLPSVYLTRERTFCNVSKITNNSCKCENCTHPRAKLSLNQLIMLEKVFSCSKYLSSQQFSALSETTNLPRKVLRIWFQNRRAKYHKEKKMNWNNFESV